MTIELLISTMHQKDHSLLDRMKVNSDAVVVNQCDQNGELLLNYNGYTVRWINTTDRGLSRSRNMAIRNATADICVLADDDMEYRNDYPQTVLSAFDGSDADIIRFQVMGIERVFKKYKPKACKVSYLQSMKMSSVEIAFRRASFVEKSILFDELIGAGTEFLMGEENAMLVQCLQKKMRICYVPQVIADLHIGESTWFTKIDGRYFMGRGASYAAMNTPFTNLLILQFAIRKRALYVGEASIRCAIRQMLNGKKLYRKKRQEL